MCEIEKKGRRKLEIWKFELYVNYGVDVGYVDENYFLSKVNKEQKFALKFCVFLTKIILPFFRKWIKVKKKLIIGYKIQCSNFDNVFF